MACCKERPCLMNNPEDDIDSLLNPPPDDRCEPDPRGLGVVLYEKMKENAEKIAQIEAQTGETLTHADILLRSIRVAQHLQEYGIKETDVISVCAGNHMNSCIPFLACMFLGIKIASLDPTLSPSDTSYLLGLVQPRIVFCDSIAEQLIQNSLDELNLGATVIVFGESSTHRLFADFLAETKTEDEFKPKPVSDIFETAVIFFSSGTTGLPKGICISHYGLLYQTAFIALRRDISICLAYATLYWVSGAIILIVTIYTGGRRVICQRFNELDFMKYVEQYKVTITFFAPILTYRFTRNPNINNVKYDTSSLQSIVIGGGPIGLDQMLAVRKLFPHTLVHNMFGMTETAGIGTSFNIFTDAHLIQEKPITVGKPMAGISYRIVDPATEEILGPNQEGELRLKSKILMVDYYNKSEEFEQAWDNDGYLYTGDIAYYDDDCCFYVIDRIKDMLKFQSWHVAPAKIENIILTHPQVGAAAVIGLPDDVDGDLPMAIIVLMPGATVTQEEIIEYVNSRVSNREQLRGGVRFVPGIPMTPTGKLRRRHIRNWILNSINSPEK